MKKICMLVLCAAMSLSFAACHSSGISSSKNDTANSVAIAKMTEDGTAYIPLMDGSYVEINEDVNFAELTKDQKHIIVFLKNGTLYVTDGDLSNQVDITSNCQAVRAYRSDGVVYVDDDNNLSRFRFSDGSYTTIGKYEDEIVDFTVSANSTSILYADEDGNVYALAMDEDEPIKVGIYSNSVVTCGISDDGEVAVWESGRDGAWDIYIYNAGEVKNVYTITSTSSFASSMTYVDFTTDQKLAAVLNSYTDEFWLIKPGEEIVSVSLGAELDLSLLQTEDKWFDEVESDSVSSVYAWVESNNGYPLFNLYNISLSGNRERVLSDLLDEDIANGRIAYIDEDDILYCADLDGDTLTNETKIASDVDILELSSDGKYVYYMKDCDASTLTGTLYCYKIDGGEAEKIASDVYVRALSYGTYMEILQASDNDMIYFFDDVTSLGDSDDKSGTLRSWSYGDDSSERIASDVVIGTVTSSLKSSEIVTDSFTFVKYNSTDKNDNVYGNWMYYDGSESNTMVKDIIV